MNRSLYHHKNHIDLSQHSLADEIDTDIVVIGTGAGGGICSEIFVQAGLRVIMVEEGPLKTHSDFKMKESVAYPDLYQEATSRKTLDKAISILQGRSVGGSTTVNWTTSFRTPKETLDFWNSEFGLSDFTPQSMMHWFESIENKLHIKPWDVVPNENNQILMRGAQSLGWKTNIIPRNVKGCANLGYCGMGCPINAKQSMLVTTIPSALDLGGRLFSRARCERILHRNGRVTGILIQALDERGQVNGANFKINAKYVVLAAGAIGTPAILIRSEVPDPFKLIGSRTFLHPVASVVADMPTPVEPFSGAPQSVYSDHFLWRDGVTGKLGFKLEVPPIHPVIASTIMPLHGQEHRDIMLGLNHLHASLALMRDGFNDLSPGGQVRLDPFGAPQLDYPLNHYHWEGVQTAYLNIAEMQFAAGAKRVRPLHMDAQWLNQWSRAKSQIKSLSLKPIRSLLFSAHVMGGARMGSSTSNSVVEPSGRLHQLNNLWVMDGSLFPTSLGVNPQLTIYALVAKLANQLVKDLK